MKRSPKTSLESFSVAKPMFYEEQEDIFKASMAFAEASWKHSTGPWLCLPKAVTIFWQSMWKFPYPGFINQNSASF